MITHFQNKYIEKKDPTFWRMTYLAGAVEYSDCISAEE